MKMRKTVLLILAALLALSVPLLAACEPEEAIERIAGSSSLVGDWKMIRGTIEPAPPVPDFIVGLFLSSKPNWKITGNPDTGKASRISFDGRDTWFTIPRLGVSGLTIDARPRQVTEPASFRMSAPGGGTIKVDRVSFIGLPEFTDVVVEYQDEVVMKVRSGDRDSNATAEAAITIRVTGGSYKMDGEARPITPYTATVSYTGSQPLQ